MDKSDKLLSSPDVTVVEIWWYEIDALVKDTVLHPGKCSLQC